MSIILFWSFFDEIKKENHYYVKISRRSLGLEVPTSKPQSSSVEGEGDDAFMTTVSNVLTVFKKAAEHGCHPGYTVALVICIILCTALAVALCSEKREKRKLIERINKGKSERLK